MSRGHLCVYRYGVTLRNGDGMQYQGRNSAVTGGESVHALEKVRAPHLLNQVRRGGGCRLPDFHLGPLAQPNARFDEKRPMTVSLYKRDHNKFSCGPGRGFI